MSDNKYFIFVDETGVNLSDRYFGIGCLLVPVEKLGEYYSALHSKQGQIITAVKKKELGLETTLSDKELIKFFKGRTSPYEMKFKNVNATTLEAYKWLITQYFKLDKLKFCCLIIDREMDNPPEKYDHFDLYLERLFMLLRNNVGDSEFVVLPDDITTPTGKIYEDVLRSKLTGAGKHCFGVHRLESHSSIFVQMVDVLVGACVHSLKNSSNLYKQEIVDKIAQKLGTRALNQNFTKISPNYFSVWQYKPKK